MFSQCVMVAITLVGSGAGDEGTELKAGVRQGFSSTEWYFFCPIRGKVGSLVAEGQV